MGQENILLFYLNNISHGGISPRAENNILDFVDANSSRLFGFDTTKIWGTHNSFLRSRTPDDNCATSRDFKTLRAMLRKANVCDVCDVCARGKNQTIDAIMQCFNLPEKYRRIVTFSVYLMLDKDLRNLANEVWGTSRFFMNKKNLDSIAKFCKTPYGTMEQILDIASPLFQYGIFQLDSDGEIEFTPPLQRILLSTKVRNTEDIRKYLLKTRPASNLSSVDFSYIASDFVYLKNLLRGAVKNKTSGINILLYGEPGVGKTELASTLCKELNLRLYEMGGRTGKQNKSSAIQELVVAQRLLSQDKGSVLLMDEAEDVFFYEHSYNDSPSKLSLNRTLEKNKRPVIWICNSVAKINNAYLRRFTHCMKIPNPFAEQRIQIWHNICAKHCVKINNSILEQYARQYTVSPGIVDIAVLNMKLTHDRNAIDKTINNYQIATIGRCEKRAFFNDTDFNPDILNTSENLIVLANKLVHCNIKKDFSMCLYGAAGTGKSLYARYLAHRLDMPVLQKKISDIKDKYVGGTEKNIAAAFEEAKKLGAMLIFDEADSLLTARDKVSASHEASFVNEMLTQMESAEIPFICTTNLMKNIDSAALRRFTFKVEYKYMTPEQAIIAFKHFFNQDISVTDVQKLTALTPGDFAVVRKRAKYTSVINQTELLNMLRDEMSAKGIIVRNKIGFYN